jgi:protocatechuate 3,4-dioxygenase beta subunit
MPRTTSRRQFLGISMGAPAALVLGAAPASVRAQSLRPTPACGDGPTRPQTEGPFFKPSSPERASLIERGTTGTPIVVSGLVVTTQCVPVKRALVDLWHSDEHGEYDNATYRFRGHQFTDEQGRYRFETIVPGVYPGRTRHFHVKVRAPNKRVLTTQLYFPDEPGNGRDPIFNPALVLKLDGATSGRRGTFDFVIPAA